MKITLQPDPEKIEPIREKKRGVELAKELLNGFGLSKTDCANWDQPHQIEVDLDSAICLNGMPCYLPEAIKPEKVWNWSIESMKEGRLIWLNGCCFFAITLNSRLLAKLPEIVINLDCSNLRFETLDPLFANFIYLKSLNLSEGLSFSKFLRDVSVLGSLTQLTSLDLSFCDSLRDVSALGSLVQLTTLNLSGCESLADVSALSNLIQLTTLNLYGCESLVDLSALSNLIQLTTLNLSGCESLVDLSALGSLIQLTSLNLSECKSLSDLSPLGNLKQLTSLNLSECKSLSDLSPLGNLKQLTSLSLSGCESLADVSQLATLIQLTSLDLSECKSLSDLSPLASLIQLTSLNLSGCLFTDLNGLAGLAQLDSLSLHSCRLLTNLKELGGLKKLTWLNLYWCESLTDINILSELSQLTWLSLHLCNLLTDVCFLENLRNLVSLDLTFCRRITKEPDYKKLSQLKELTIDKHPCFVADTLAYCAISRQDWREVQKYLKGWLNELGLAIHACHPNAIGLAISLAIGVPHLKEQKSTYNLLEVLNKGIYLPSQPWSPLFRGTLEIVGFSALVEVAGYLPAEEWTSGAIGGLCTVVPLLKKEPASHLFAQNFIWSTNARHRGNPAYLRPIAAQWCLALAELGEEQLLKDWLDLFTNPGDPSALDSIHLQFSRQALTSGDPEKTLKLSFRIHGPQVRDELLMELADYHLQCGEAGQAGDLLFILSHPESRSSLAKKLAAVPGYFDEPKNLHRVLAAFGSDGEAIRLLSDKISVDKIVQALPREELRELLVIECMKMVSRGLGVSEAEAKQVLIKEVQKTSSIRNIDL